MISLFASPDGCDDHPGTASRPFKTLERAQNEARAASGDVVVHLRGGTYELTRTWSITNDRDEHITYQAFGWGEPDQEKPIISGGQRVTGWRVQDGIWTADIAGTDFQQLYVEDEKVEMAKLTKLPGTWERTATGYKVDTILDLDAPESAQLVYHGVFPWTEARLNISAIEHHNGSTYITMAQPGWERAGWLYNYCWEGLAQYGPQEPSWLENDVSFLRDPGTFTVDRAKDGISTLHYKTRPGETPERTNVEIPALQQLLKAQEVKNVAFRGITFTKATWLQPVEGFLHYYGNYYYAGKGALDKVVLGGDDGSWVMVPREMDEIGACLELSKTSNVRFEGCRFTRLGGAAIRSDGCEDVCIEKCVFEDLPSLGVSLVGSRNSSISDTLITRNGLDFPGSPAISIQGTENCVFSNNEVTDTSHSGIILAANHGLHVTNNLISKTMGRLADGGGIHVAYSQGDSLETGLVFNGNVVEDVRTEYNIAIYTDDGSEWVTIENNVVKRADSTIIFEATPPINHIVYRGNFWDKEPDMPEEMPEGILYEDNRVIESENELIEAAKEVLKKAGIRMGRG